jgi:hypothetical protein
MRISAAVALAWRTTFDSPSVSGRHQLIGDEVGQVSTSPTRRSTGSNPRWRARSWTNSVSWADRFDVLAVLAEPEDGRSEFADRVVEFVDGGSDPVGDHRWLRSRLDGLEVHARGEESLDHHVVEVAGDAFAIEQHRHLRGRLLAVADVADGGDGVVHPIDRARAEADLDREHHARKSAGRRAAGRFPSAGRRIACVVGSSLADGRRGTRVGPASSIDDPTISSWVLPNIDPSNRVGEADDAVGVDEQHPVGAGVEQCSCEFGAFMRRSCYWPNAPTNSASRAATDAPRRMSVV